MSKPRHRRGSPRDDSFEELLRSLNLGSLGSLAGMFLQGVGTFMGPNRKIVDQMGQFATHFANHAREKWPSVELQSQRCVMVGCPGDAILNCMACGKSVCLAHIHVSFRAEGVCDECVRLLLKMRGGAAQAQSGQVRPASEAEVLVALRRLGLRRGAEWADIQIAHRKLAAKYHPDLARTPADKTKREQRCKEINEAFSLLKRYCATREQAP